MIQEQSKKSSRKKFLLWSAALISSVGLGKLLPRQKNKQAPAKPTVKMLSQDGTLVEIDQELLAAATKKVTKEELQNWIKK
jgi:hypothetical protein